MSSRVLKVFHGDDVRRLRLEMPEDDQKCFESVQTAVAKAFGLQNPDAALVSVALMCKEQDVLCELTPRTLRSLLNESDDSCMRLYICETGCIEDSPEGDVPGGPAERKAGSEELPDGSAPDNAREHTAGSEELGDSQEVSDSEEFESVGDASEQGNASAEVHERASSRLTSWLTPDMEKKPDHVAEGFAQGLHHMANHVSQGVDKLKSKAREGHQQQGILGELKGTGEGLLSVGHGVWKGVFDLRASTVKGLRRTPDVIADHVNSERLHNKHGLQGEGRGELFETNLDDDEEPQHVVHGFKRGVKGLGRGFSSGFKALVERPRDACREKGIKGLPEGLGQGVLGLGTNVGAGAFDYGLNMSLGWKNTPEAIVRALKKENSADVRTPATPSNTVDVSTSQDDVQPVDVSPSQDDVQPVDVSPSQDDVQPVDVSPSQQDVQPVDVSPSQDDVQHVIAESDAGGVQSVAESE